MLTDNLMDTAKFRLAETLVISASDGCHPKLRLPVVPGDVHMRGLIAVRGVREHSVWTIPQEGGQRDSRAELE
jgi:hypothetical protein